MIQDLCIPSELCSTICRKQPFRFLLSVAKSEYTWRSVKKIKTKLLYKISIKLTLTSKIKEINGQIGQKN